MEINSIDIKSKDWLENSPVCTKVVDPDFNLRYMSRAGIEALKIDDVNQYYGKSFPLDFYPNEFKDSMCAMLNEAKNTGERRIHEGMIRTPDNDELWFESTISPIYDELGVLDYFMVVSVAINERKEANAKDILLKEIHHRIKNNLQVVSSLLSLQVNETTDDTIKKVVDNSKKRIAAISLVHEKMYESDVSGEIFVKPYIEELIHNISETFSVESHSIKKEIYIDEFKLNMDKLVPCGLILNEILTNIFKYGFTDHPYLKIEVRKRENEIEIVVADDGPGFMKEDEDKKKRNLGRKLVEALCLQLDATLVVDSKENKGVCYIITFEL